MKSSICLLLICLGWAPAAPAQEKAATTTTVFQIGAADHDYHEFALAGNHGAYGRKFPRDVVFVVGKSEAKTDWPFVQPGPADTWAGSRAHAFKIGFELPEVSPSYYRLVLDFVDTHGWQAPHLTVDVNGALLKFQLPAGRGDDSLTNPKAGRNYSLEQLIPPALMRRGSNTITVINDGGSWLLYDDVRLESGAAAPAQPVRLQAEGLPCLKRSAEGLQRMVKVSVENLAGGGESAALDWKAGTQSGQEKLDLRFGHNELLLALPETEQQTVLELALKTGAREVKATATLRPTRRWRVYIVPTVHTDIGYTDLQTRVMARHADNTVQALAMAEKYPAFNWDFETYWQLDCFLRAHPDRAEEVFARLRSGRMGLSAFFGNMLTGLCSHEALNRATLNARSLANRGGFEFASVILDDVPSAVGSLPMILGRAGIKYFIEGVNGERAPFAARGLKTPFYWEGPDGSRVLSHIAGGYGAAGSLISSLEQANERLPGFLTGHDNADYPYDAVLVNGAFVDNHGVESWLPEVVSQWNARWEYPKLILGRPEDFFRYLEQNFAAKIPVVRGDFGTWWEDDAGTSARETALCRRAEERAVTAEMLHSLTAVLAGAKYPKAEFDDLWRNILLYDEHTWGAWCSVSAPQSEQTLKQWEVKSSYARRADEISRRLLQEGMTNLVELTPAFSSDLVVFNPLAWSRKALVVTEETGSVRDMETKRSTPCQALSEGGSCFIAADLPSIGFRTYHKESALKSATNAVRFAEGQMENEFYRVSFDGQTGGLKSIVDKETGRELVDPESEYRLGELIYVSGGEGTSAVHSDLTLPAPNFVAHRQQALRVEQNNGPVFGEWVSTAKAEKLPQITLRVRLYHGLKRIDLSCELHKEETTNKEAVYVAFPFALELAGGGLWLEYPDAITEPLKDQHGSACRDFYATQRWLAASDGQMTVVLSPLDTPLVTLGGMTASTWPRQLALKRAHVFAYVMNNYWYTNSRAGQGGRHLFRFSLTSAPGPCSKKDCLTRGWELFCPPVAQTGLGRYRRRVPPVQSLLSVEPAGLPLLALKQAEDQKGYILRLGDFAGTGGQAKVALPRPAGAVFDCDLVEANPVKQGSAGATVTTRVKPFGPSTVRVTFE